MKKHLLATALLASSFTANATIVEMQTDLGSITIHLYDQQTPVTVENFLNNNDIDLIKSLQEEKESFHDTEGIYKGAVTSTQQWIEPLSDFAKQY